MTHHIAVDIGASSGRLMLGQVQDQRLMLRELHRFPNGLVRQGEAHHWDIDGLIHEILLGLQKAKQQGINHCTLAIDTWAVDYVLVGADGHKLKEAVAYRDRRTEGMMATLAKELPLAEHYDHTGIQFLTFNTIYQLAAETTESLTQAQQILLIPDYIGYVLTGQGVSEYTNATTTAMVDHRSGTWHPKLLAMAGVRRDQFPPLVQPGHLLGPLLSTWAERYDLPECQVYVAATHDTASAVLAVPVTETKPFAYISSGTWSLLGTENSHAVTTPAALAANYSNEGGAFGTYRFLKNIMGLWLIQEVRRLWQETTGEAVSFDQLVHLAEQEPGGQFLIDANDPCFLNPPDMITAIQTHCTTQGKPAPQTLGQLARCVFDSLALCYQQGVHELEQLTGQSLDTLYIIGGGSQNDLLNQLTANATGKTVVAGPIEATAIGNLLVQLIAIGSLPNLATGRALVQSSFPLKTFTPMP